MTGDLGARIDAFVAQYSHRRNYENLRSLTPAAVCFGHGQLCRGNGPPNRFLVLLT